jgi:hypothetical protein
MRQIEKMRELLRSGLTDDEIVEQYAAAERRGEVPRDSNVHGLTPEDYGRRLLRNTRRTR